MFLGVVLEGRGDLGEPGVEVVAGDAAQDGVDEARAAVAEDDAGEFDGRRDGGVRGDAGAEELVGAEAEHVEHGRVDLAQRAVHARGDDRVVRTASAQRPVDEFGGERGVARVEAALLAGLAQERGQDEVGVGVALVDGAQGVEGEDADGVLARRPVRAAPAPAAVGGGRHGLVVQRCVLHCVLRDG